VASTERPIYIVIDDPAAGRQVGGLPLVVRLSRQLGWAGLRPAGLVVTTGEGDDAGGETWSRLLGDAGQAPPIPVVPADQVPAEAVRLSASALYPRDPLKEWLHSGAEPEPIAQVTDRASQRAAERRLWRSIRKPLRHDGPVAYFLIRPVSSRISRLLVRTGLAPNVITTIGLVTGLGAGVLAGLGGFGPVLGATLLFLAGLVLDCVDGEMARVTLSTSRSGQWLDTIADDLSVMALTVGMGVGLSRTAGQPAWLWLGLGGGALMLISQSVIYYWLWRSGGPIDTAKYPWFFSRGEGLAQESERSLLGWVAILGRRDSLTILFLVLAAGGWHPAILVILAGGGAVYCLLLGLDRLIKGLGRAREAS
jgi:phosphatidylglycerophosphate synthase